MIDQQRLTLAGRVSLHETLDNTCIWAFNKAYSMGYFRKRIGRSLRDVLAKMDLHKCKTVSEALESSLAMWVMTADLFV
jgi:hypothetical protein